MQPFDSQFLLRIPLFFRLLDRQPATRDWVEGLGCWPSFDELNSIAAMLKITTASGLPIQFVPAKPQSRQRRGARKNSGPQYELQVYHTGEIPTRTANWHDFFNAFAWFLFPQTKAALNHRQIEAWTPGVIRTLEQNRLTMFDEGGVVFAKTEILVIGHAIFEELFYARRAIRGMVLSMECSLEDADSLVAKAIHSGVMQQNETFPVFDFQSGILYSTRGTKQT